jgi:hypothetical protein
MSETPTVPTRHPILDKPKRLSKKIVAAIDKIVSGALSKPHIAEHMRQLFAHSVPTQRAKKRRRQRTS